MENCISLERLGKFMHGVLSRPGALKESFFRVVRVDASVVESTKNIVEWKNASHLGDLEHFKRTLL